MNLLSLLLLLTSLLAVDGCGTYVVVAPIRLRAGMTYNLSVNVLQAEFETNVTAHVLRSSDNFTVAQATSLIPKDNISTISLQMPDTMQDEDYYVLNVTGTGGLTFSQIAPVAFISKAMSIFVQTDKTVYKPGQTVNFRVLAIYPNLTVYTGDFNVDVHDGKGNKIKQWKGLRGEVGVVTQMLELSSQPVLGEWSIRVTAGNEEAEKPFSVEEYVLPQFEVTVQLPPYVLVSADSFPVTVRAKYTYGKPVSGAATLNVSLEYTYYYRDAKFITQTAQLNNQGEAVLTLLMSDLKLLTPYLSFRKLRVTAEVTESLTGLTQNGMATVQVYSDPFLVTFSSSNQRTYKPGLEYTGYVQVAEPNRRPLTSSRGQEVTVTAIITTLHNDHCWPRCPQETTMPEQYAVLDDAAKAEFKFTFPSDATSVRLMATYQNKTSYNSLLRSSSPSNSFLHLYLLNNDVLRAGEEVVFGVKSTEKVSTLVYQVLSRGTIVSAGKVSLNHNHTFNLTLTSNMAPKAHIVCYYVRPDLEIVADSFSFNVENMFINKVLVSVSKKESQPSDTVDVTVHASPQSTAFILAVDQSVLLLGSGNDVTQGQVAQEMNEYDLEQGFDGTFAREIFADSGMLVLSDTPQDYGPRYSPWDNGFNRQRGLSLYSLNLAEEAPYSRTVRRPITDVDTSDSIDKDSLLEADRVRNLFPETWLWTNISVDGSGSGNLTTPVPDTITSWVVSAFAVSPSTGLGVAPTAAKLRVFRPFFAALNLPYSVTRGEQVVIQAVIFNYLDKDQNVRVTLVKSQNFQNLQLLDDGQEQLVSEDQTEDVKVPAGEGKSVYFPIVPTKLGFIDIEVSARSSVAADALRKTLLVEPEGVEKEFSVSVLVDLKTLSSFSQTVPVGTLPSNLVPDSTRARITAIGDLMGPSVKSLDNLLKLPTGCGEQNMINLAPDVFIASYLNATNQLTADISEKVVKFMESGYQRQLTYKHDDGSFSAFGKIDPSGSMWLTAFVVKTFHQAKPFIFVDANVIAKAVKWMVDRQDKNGSFSEPGRVLDRGLQGSSGNKEGLTAYVLISLLELQDLPEGFNMQSVSLAITKAADYLKQRLPQISDNYVLAMTTYALTLARDPAADAAFDKLLTTATISNGLRHWHNQKQEIASSSELWLSPQTVSSDVLITAYVLLTYTTRQDYTGGIDVMKWVALQRNPYGGYSSTQDTVLALQALSQYARFLTPGKLDMQVSVTTGSDNRMFVIDQQRALELQVAELSSVPSFLTVNATGSGIALISLSLFFNVKTDVVQPAFKVNVTLLKDEIKVLHLQTCATWLANGTSGMAVQEVGIPSGFTADIKSISQHKFLKRTDLRDKKVILYFDEIGAEPVCTTLEAKRTGLVAKTQPVPVRVYDYYRPENQATIFYKPSALESTNVCDICQDCKCPKSKRK